MPYEKYKRFWAVTDAAGQLICLAVYRKGAQEVLRRLGMAESSPGSVPVTLSPEAVKPRPRSSNRKTPYRLESGRQVEIGRQTEAGRQVNAGRQQRRRRGR